MRKPPCEETERQALLSTSLLVASMVDIDIDMCTFVQRLSILYNLCVLQENLDNNMCFLRQKNYLNHFCEFLDLLVTLELKLCQRLMPRYCPIKTAPLQQNWYQLKDFVILNTAQYKS